MILYKTASYWRNFKYSILLVVLLFQCSSKGEAPKENSFILNSTKIDSTFFHHFALLDSSVNDKFVGQKQYPLKRIREAMEFMESLSSINSTSSGSTIGRFDATQRDLVVWKEWYTKNRRLLLWDATHSKIVYSDSSKSITDQ